MRSKLSSIALYGILFVFFFQLIADFVKALYAFGLLRTGLPVEMVSLLFLFSPLVLVLVPNRLAGWPLVALGELMIVCRVLEPMLDTRNRMLVAGLGVACFLLLLPVLVTRRDAEASKSRGLALGIGLTVALSLSILFRVLNSGTDISTTGWFQAIGWVLAITGGVLMLGFLERGPASQRDPSAAGDDAQPAQARPGFWRTAGLALGVTAVLTLLYFSFTSPNVIARWTGFSYLFIVSIVALVLSLFAILLVAAPRMVAALTPRVVMVWNLLFVLSMVLTILAHQITFATDPGAYPLAEPAVAIWHRLPLLLMLVLFPVVLVDLRLLAQDLADRRPSSRRLGGAFALASLFLLFMMLAHIFTTTYAYIPVVGPFFRDKFWLVYLIVGLAVMLPPLLLVRRSSFDLAQAVRRLDIGPAFPGLIVLVSLMTVAGALLIAANPPDLAGQPASLRVLAYNVQQGYGPDGLENVEGQLALMRQIDADIIGLSESDTNRIAGGNTDLVRYLADRLDMHSYYGPKTVPGTFGIALLSRYPIQNARTFYLYSYEPVDGQLEDLEQTAAIEAEVVVGDRTFDVFVTHLGNDGPMVQQLAVLAEVDGKGDAILMGDFNFDPDTEQYALTTAMLDDAWALRWPDVDKRSADFTGEGIDHIFVQAGTWVTEARYWPQVESDHPAVTADIEW